MASILPVKAFERKERAKPAVVWVWAGLFFCFMAKLGRAQPMLRWSKIFKLNRVGLNKSVKLGGTGPPAQVNFAHL